MSETITAAERERAIEAAEYFENEAVEWRRVASKSLQGAKISSANEQARQFEGYAEAIRALLRAPTSPVGEPAVFVMASALADVKRHHGSTTAKLFDATLASRLSRINGDEAIPLYRAAPTSQPIGDVSK